MKRKHRMERVRAEKLFTYKEVGKMLAVCLNTVKSYIATGKLHNVVLGRKTKRVMKSDLDAFILSMRR